MSEWTECGGPNPLAKVASHFTQDKGRQQDHVRYVPPTSTSIEPPEHAFVKEFLSTIPSQSKPFEMREILKEIREMEHQQARSGSILQAPPVATTIQEKWASEFENFKIAPGNLIPPSDGAWAQEFMSHPPLNAEEGPPIQQDLEWDAHWDDITAHAEGKESHFVPSTSSDLVDPIKQTASQIIGSMSDPQFAESEFLRFMHQIKKGEVTLNSQTEQVDQDQNAARSTLAFGNSNWAEEFLGVGFSANEGNGVVQQPSSSADQDWTKDFLAEASANQSRPPDLADQWTQEFTEGASAEVFRSDNSQEDFWLRLQQDWDKAADEDPSSLGWLKEPLADVTTQNEYAFEAENPYQDHSDPFSQGTQKRLEGDLPSAILFFEAAVQKDPEHAKAWELLGLSLAENEQDPGAITAYKRCLSLEPMNLVALMGLAVSYTNESFQLQACQALENWLKNNPKYAHLMSSSMVGGSTSNPPQLNLVSSLVSADVFNRVQSSYLDAARLQPAADLDPDVQTGLGVLLNLSSDFDKAVDCFRSALVVRPSDALLWNRLGATLANGGRSEEAVQAYYKALEISPGFIRARYNLAVSCINLGVHREAAEHLVSALQLQSRRSKRVMSDNIWSTLRMVLNLMSRREFHADIDARDLTRLAAEFGTNE